MKLHFYTGWLTAILYIAFLALEVVDAGVVPSTGKELDGTYHQLCVLFSSDEGSMYLALGSYAGESYCCTVDNMSDVRRHAFPDFLKSTGFTAKKYTETILHDATTTYTSTTSQIAEFQTSMMHVISSTGDFRLKLEAQGISLENLSELVALGLSTRVEEIKKEFPPPDHAEHHAERSEMVSRILEEIGNVVVRVSMSVGVPEEEVRAHLEAVLPHMLRVLVLTGE